MIALGLENCLPEVLCSNARARRKSPTGRLLILTIPKALVAWLWDALICRRYKYNLAVARDTCWEISTLARSSAVWNMVFHLPLD